MCKDNGKIANNNIDLIRKYDYDNEEVEYYCMNCDTYFILNKENLTKTFQCSVCGKILTDDDIVLG